MEAGDKEDIDVNSDMNSDAGMNSDLADMVQYQL